MSALDRFYLTENMHRAFSRWVNTAIYLEDEDRIQLKDGMSVCKAPLRTEYYCVLNYNKGVEKLLINKCPLGYIQTRLEFMYNDTIENLRKLKISEL